jgi:hypothetical protein
MRAEPYLRVGSVEEAMVAYHAEEVAYTAQELADLREHVRAFIQPNIEQARKQAASHEARLKGLQAEQLKLVQLSYKDMIDDEVLAAEQERIRQERAEVARWKATATQDAALIEAALDDALLLVGPGLPYAMANPMPRRLLNQATQDSLAPFIVTDDKGGPQYRIRGRRDPFYVEADRLIGRTPPELAGEGPGRPHNAQNGDEAEGAPISWGPSSDESRLAEREGFEPSMEFNPHTRLAGECLQPLGHLSRAGQSRRYRHGRPASRLSGRSRSDRRIPPAPESLASPGRPGGVAERLNAAVLKTVDGGNVVRGFESLPLRPHARLTAPRPSGCPLRRRVPRRVV